jgi:hypothetical protein
VPVSFPRPRGRATAAHAVLRVCLIGSCIACEAGSTSTPVMRLRPASATFREGFSRLTSVVELAGGIVLVSDSKDGVVLRIDSLLAAGSNVGRRGSGPLEFIHSTGLSRISPDSALQVDWLSRRLLVFTSKGPVAQPPWPEDWSLQWSFHGADTLGTALLSFAPRGASESSGDSLRVVRLNRRTGVGDTIAKLRAERPWSQAKPNRAYPGDMEQAHISPDGWVAIVRIQPLRVDWRSPDGAWTRGNPLGIPDIAVDEAERAYYLTQSGANNPDPRWLESIDWPEKASAIPFQLYPTMAPNGWLVLRRQASTKWRDGLHDIVDRSGKLVAHLQMSPEQKIVGYGKAAVYVVTTDDAGLQFLSRHPWPPAAL